MPNERRIEKLLRAFAKKRKADAGAPLEMHPSTRRLLQGEVARRLKTRPTTEQHWWRFWFGTPRRAFVTCAFVSVLISGTVFLTTMKPTKPTMNLAKNENKAIAGKPVAEPMRALETQPAPVVTPPPSEMPAPMSPVPPSATVALADRKDADAGLSRMGGGGGGGFGGSASTTPPASASVPPVAYDYIATNGATAAFALNEPVGQALDKAKIDSTIAMQKDVSSTTFGGLQANREPSSTSAATPALDTEKQLIAEAKAPQSNISTLNFAGDGSRFENLGALQVNGAIPAQQFYRLRALDGAAEDSSDKSRVVGMAKKQSAGDVLDSFSVTQDGDKITVVDSDGSQYSGFIQPAALSGEVADAPVAAPVTASAPGQTSPARRITGTLTSAGAYNTVTFDSGAAQNFAFKVTGTNLSLKQLVVFSGSFVAMTNGVVTRNGLVTNAVATDPFGPQPVMQNSRIVGRAAVGKKTEVKIEAAPVGP